MYLRDIPSEIDSLYHDLYEAQTDGDFHLAEDILADIINLEEEEVNNHKKFI